MLVITSQQALKDALAQLKLTLPGATHRKAWPISGAVKLEAKDDALFMSTTDYQSYQTVRVEAEVLSAGIGAVLLDEFKVRNDAFGPGPVKLHIADETRITASRGRRMWSHWAFLVEDIEKAVITPIDTSVPAEGGKQYRIRCDLAALVKPLLGTIGDTDQIGLNGVWVQVGHDTIGAFSTNNTQITAHRPLSQDDVEHEFLLAKDACTAITRCLQGEVDVTIDSRPSATVKDHTIESLTIRTGNTFFYTNTVEGDVPNVESVWSSSRWHVARTVNAQALQKALKAHFAAHPDGVKSHTHKCTISFTSVGVQVSGHGETVELPGEVGTSIDRDATSAHTEPGDGDVNVKMLLPVVDACIAASPNAKTARVCVRMQRGASGTATLETPMFSVWSQDADVFGLAMGLPRLK